jgi:hypothetical protein
MGLYGVIESMPKQSYEELSQGFRKISETLQKLTKRNGKPFIGNTQLIELIAAHTLKGDGPTIEDRQMLQLVKIALEEGDKELRACTNPDAYGTQGVIAFNDLYKLVMGKKAQNQIEEEGYEIGDHG